MDTFFCIINKKALKTNWFLSAFCVFYTSLYKLFICVINIISIDDI